MKWTPYLEQLLEKAMRENLQLCERERALWRTKDLAVIVTASSGEEINSKQLASKLQQWRALGHPCMVLHKNPLQVGRSVVACDLTSHPCQSPSLDTSSSTRGASAAIVLGDDIPPQALHCTLSSTVVPDLWLISVLSATAIGLLSSSRPGSLGPKIGRVGNSAGYNVSDSVEKDHNADGEHPFVLLASPFDADVGRKTPARRFQPDRLPKDPKFVTCPPPSHGASTPGAILVHTYYAEESVGRQNGYVPVTAGEQKGNNLKICFSAWETAPSLRLKTATYSRSVPVSQQRIAFESTMEEAASRPALSATCNENLQIPTASGREVGVRSEAQNGVAGTAVELA
ncbi:hypothetical protein B0H14DRAFT_3736206 [Mycena olivaceomarginata]|nr:hypothetical protein B0H14DRAFT_3736206 [Mycena olivaceomarginata]